MCRLPPRHSDTLARSSHRSVQLTQCETKDGSVLNSPPECRTPILTALGEVSVTVLNTERVSQRLPETNLALGSRVFLLPDKETNSMSNENTIYLRAILILLSLYLTLYMIQLLGSNRLSIGSLFSTLFVAVPVLAVVLWVARLPER
mgnify:CR=1 FL=1